MRFYGLLALALACLLPACMQRLEVMRADINNIKSDTYKNQKETADMKASLSAMSKEIDTLRSSVEKAAKQDTTETMKESQASLYMQIQELLNEVRTLKGGLDEERHLRETSLKTASGQDELLASKQADLEKSLKDIEARLVLMEEALKKLSEAKKEEQTAISGAGEGLRAPAEEAYENAYTAFTGKRYPEAREKFAQFLKTYPDHKLAGNAQFWLGETYYFQKDYENAILAYEEVIKKYSDSPKLPASMLKQAMSFIELGDKKAATVILKELVGKYPESEQAPTAKKKLDELSPPVRLDEKPKK